MKYTYFLLLAVLFTFNALAQEMLRITECSPSYTPSKTILNIKADSPEARRFIADTFSLASSVAPDNRIHIRPTSNYIRVDIFSITDRGIQQVILESDHPFLQMGQSATNQSEPVTSDDYRKFVEVFDQVHSRATKYIERGNSPNP